MNPSSDASIMMPIAVSVFEILVFAMLVWALLWFCGFAWRRLPARVLNVSAADADKTVAVLVSLLLFPSLVQYAWTVAVSLQGVLPAILSQTPGMQLLQDCQGPVYACGQSIATSLSLLLSNVAYQANAALNLGGFPVADFVWFLLLSVILSGAVGLLHRELTAGRFYAVAARGYSLVTPQFKQRFVFSAVIVLSFYLGLSALLAIPLFQDRGRTEQLTAANLAELLKGDKPAADAFDKQFPPLLHDLHFETIAAIFVANPGTQDQPQGNGAGFLSGQSIARYLSDEMAHFKDSRDEIQTLWANARSTVTREQEAAIGRAANAFSIGSEESSGGHKQTAIHYFSLRQWYQDHVIATNALLGECLKALEQGEADFLQKFTRAGNVSAAYNHAVNPQADQALVASVNTAFSELGQVASAPYSGARMQCQVLDFSSLPGVKERPKISTQLGPVGWWSGWLLNTEQMPVVIIVGLVGFSVLGATVSRSVRAGTEKVTAGITLDDLMIVIASGTTAAVVVFLAAYGGLAVLGNAGGDPNPYIVFATCLVAAVYSDRVWTWARERVLAQALAPGGKPARETKGSEHDGSGSDKTGSRRDDTEGASGAAKETDAALGDDVRGGRVEHPGKTG